MGASTSVIQASDSGGGSVPARGVTRRRAWKTFAKRSSDIDRGGGVHFRVLWPVNRRAPSFLCATVCVCD